MEPLDIVKYIGSSLGPRLVTTTIYPLSFEHTEESLAGRIVRITANGAHAGNQVVTSQKALILLACELAAPI